MPWEPPPRRSATARDARSCSAASSGGQSSRPPHRIQAATGCAVWVDTFPAVIEQGRGIPRFDAGALLPRAGHRRAGRHRHAGRGRHPGARSRSSATRSLGRSSLLADDCEVVVVAPGGVRGHLGLDAVADVLDLDDRRAVRRRRRRPRAPPTGDLDVMTMGAMVAALQPEGAIVVNEAATSGLGWAIALRRRRPARGVLAHRRCHRPGPPCRRRRRGGRTRPQGDRPPGRRFGHVHAAGAVDDGSRVARRHGRRLRQPGLPHPADGAAPHRPRRPGPAGPVAHRPRRARRSTGSRWPGASASRACRRRRSTNSRAGLERGLATDGPYLVEVLL